jgi:hypothetical protein
VGSGVLSGSMRRLFLKNRNTNQSVRVESLSLQLAVGRKTRRRSWQTVAPGGRVGGGGAPIVVSRCVVNAEVVVRQSPVIKDVSKEAGEATALEAVTRRQLVKVQ